MSDSEADLGLGSPEGSGSPEPQPKRVKDMQLSRYPASHSSEQVLFGRIPAFLDIEPKPFDSGDTSQFEMPVNPNTIRWKYGRNEQGDMDKLSNARVVEWEDGSRTLQVGDEQFEIRTQSPAEPIFIAAENNKVIDTLHIVDEQITLIPASTASDTHKRLARQLAARVSGQQVHVSAHATTDDPTLLQRNTIAAESAKEKARRKLESKREQDVPVSRSYMSSRAHSDSEEDSEGAEEEDEEEEAELTDVEEDSDDEDNRGDRLQAIKRKNEEQEGPSRRRKMVDDDSD